MVTVATFKAQYQEFQNADDTMVAAAISDAYLITPVSVWKTKQDTGVALRVAKKLALSPLAKSMELASSDGKTVYDAQLNELIVIVAGGGFVI